MNDATAGRAATWDAVFEGSVAGQRSWDGAALSWSRDLLDRADSKRGSVVDVGCGESVLVDALIDDGWGEITLLDVSAVALERVRARLATLPSGQPPSGQPPSVQPPSSRLDDEGRPELSGTSTRQGAPKVEFIASDVLDWRPSRTFTAWHDRAVLHFLTEPAERSAYVALSARALAPGGGLVLGGFAPDGPEKCSGLPVARRAADELAAEFAEHFDLEESWRHVHSTPWGAEQSFTWVLMRRHSR